MKALLYVWSAPWGLVGLLVEVLFRALGWCQARDRRRHSMIVCGPLATRMSRKWNAVTIGWSVFYWSVPSERTINHETRHVQQCLLFGPLLPVLYLACLVVYGYRENPFEVDARKHAV